MTTVGIKIQGVGDATGQWEFVLQDSGSGDPREKPWIVDVPSLSGSSVHPYGGVRTQGEMSFSIVDVDNSLTAQLATQGAMLTRLSGAVGTSNTSLTFDANHAAFYAGKTVAIGREAIRLDLNTSGSTWTVTRGVLGTAATTHASKSVVFPRLRHLAGRSATIVVGGRDLGTWWLDVPQLDKTLNCWTFTARSPDRILDRTPTSSWQGRSEYQLVDQVAFGNSKRMLPRTPEQWYPHMAQRVYVTIGSSVVRCKKTSDSQHLEIERVGVGGTSSDLQFSSGIREVMVSDPTEPAAYRSFRWSTTATYVDAWTPTDHPVPIILSILTSGHPDGIANGTADLGYYGCLPYGLGIPAGDIDAQSVKSVWERTQRASLPHFVFDPATGKVRDTLSKICLYSGISFGWSRGKWVFSTRSGTVDANLPREEVSLAEDGSPEVVDVVFTDEYMVSRVEVKGVQYRLGNFSVEFGPQSGSGDDYPLTLPSDWIRPDSRGRLPEYATQRALALLRSFASPLWSVSVSTPLDVWMDARLSPGDVLTFGWSELPDSATGTRGVATTTRWIVLEEKPDLASGRVLWRLLSDGPAWQTGRIAPSARIVSVSVNDVTVRANYYTDSDNRGGYPTTDASAFSLGDVVQVTDRQGTVVVTSPTSTTVQAISGNTLTLATGIGAAGQVLECVSVGSSSARRVLESVFMDSGWTVQREA